MKRWFKESASLALVGWLASGCSGQAGDSGADSGGRAGSGGAGGSAQSGTGGSAAGGQGGDPVADLLSDPAVQSALEEARDAGVPIVTHTDKQPPDLTGYYSYGLGVGTWVASGNGENVGFRTTAAELRVDMQPNGTADTAIVSSFDGVTPLGAGVDTGYFVRGTGNEVTLYGLRTTSCPVSGSNYELEQTYIWSGIIDESSGDWLEQWQFTVTTATQGELTADCPDVIVGNEEVFGGWAVAYVPGATKIGVDELVLMCVGEDRGYVPPETWTETDGVVCECASDFTVECGG